MDTMLSMYLNDVTVKIGILVMTLAIIWYIQVISKELSDKYKTMKHTLQDVERRHNRLKEHELYLCHKLRDELENRYCRSIIAATLRTTIEEVRTEELRNISNPFDKEFILQEIQELSNLDPLMNRFAPTFQPLHNQLYPEVQDTADFGSQENFWIGDNNLVKRGKAKMCKAAGAKSKTEFDRKRKHLQHKLNKPIVKQIIKNQLAELKRPVERKENSTFVYNADVLYFQNKQKINILKPKRRKSDQRTYSVQSFPNITLTINSEQLHGSKRSFSYPNFGNAKENNHEIHMKKRYQYSCSKQLEFESKVKPLLPLKAELRDVIQFRNVNMSLIKSNETFNQSLVKVRSEPNCGIQVDFVKSDLSKNIIEKFTVKTRKNKIIMVDSILEETLNTVNFKRCHICMNSGLVEFGKLNTRAYKILVKLKKSIILLKFSLYFISKKRKGSYHTRYLRSIRKSKIEENSSVPDKNAQQLKSHSHLNDKSHRKRHSLLTQNIRRTKTESVTHLEKYLEVGEHAEGDFDHSYKIKMTQLKQLLFQQIHCEKDDVSNQLEFYTEEEINKAILKQCIGLGRDGFMDASTFCEHIPEIMYCLKNERKLTTILEEPCEETNEFYEPKEYDQTSSAEMAVERKFSSQRNYYSFPENIECKTPDEGHLTNNSSVIAIFDENEVDVRSSLEEQTISDCEQSITFEEEEPTDHFLIKDFTVRLSSSKRNMMLYFEDKKLLSLGEFSGSKTYNYFKSCDEIPNLSESPVRRTLLSRTNNLNLETLFQNDNQFSEPKEMCSTIAQICCQTENFNTTLNTAENLNNFPKNNLKYFNTFKELFNVNKITEQFIETPISSIFLGIETQDLWKDYKNSSENHRVLSYSTSNFVAKHQNYNSNDSRKEEYEPFLDERQPVNETLIIDHKFDEDNSNLDTPTILVEGTLIGTTQNEMEDFNNIFSKLILNVERFKENSSSALERRFDGQS